jgi:hypothetical protein
MKELFDEDETSFESSALSNAKKPSERGGLLFGLIWSWERRRVCFDLLRRSRGEDFAPAWLGFRFRFRRLLGFFSTFVFASHE